MNGPGWHGGVLTESDIVCNAVGHVIDVLPMWLTEYIPVCRLEAVLQCLSGLLCLTPHCPGVHRLPSHKGDILGSHHDQVVV